jgi:hypothetical protein
MDSRRDSVSTGSEMSVTSLALRSADCRRATLIVFRTSPTRLGRLILVWPGTLSLFLPLLAIDARAATVATDATESIDMFDALDDRAEANE